MRNCTEVKEFPIKSLELDPTDWLKVGGLLVVFCVAAVGNLCVLRNLLRMSRMGGNSPMHVLLLNLCLADLIVVFMLIPSEIIWAVAGHWYAGNIMCKVVQFARAFGLFLSSSILICISVDRYYAVVHPLRALHSQNRIRVMVWTSWLAAIICSVPQAIIFRLETKVDKGFLWMQCLSIWVGPDVELLNTLLHILVQYLIPLLVIILCYGGILYKIHAADATKPNLAGRTILRRSGPPIAKRARMSTVKLAAVIILAFVVCWTPYAVIALWSVVDEEAVRIRVNRHIKDFLFQMVLANSCANPILYGIYAKKNSNTLQASTPSNNIIEMHSTHSVCFKGERGRCNGGRHPRFSRAFIQP